MEKKVRRSSPFSWKGNRKSIEGTGREQGRELRGGRREKGKGREGDGEADKINWKRHI